MPYSNLELRRQKGREYSRRWRERNPERYLDQARKRRERDPEKHREAVRRHRLRHPERAIAQSRACEERRRGKRKINLVERRFARQRRRALLANVAVSDFTPGEWLVLKDEFGGMCAYCGEVKPLQQDHVQPLSKGGQHTYDNIVPACKSCNSSKRDKTYEDFTRVTQTARSIQGVHCG